MRLLFFMPARNDTHLPRAILFGAFAQPELAGKYTIACVASPQGKVRDTLHICKVPASKPAAPFPHVKKLSARLPRCAALRGPQSNIIRKSLALSLVRIIPRRHIVRALCRSVSVKCAFDGRLPRLKRHFAGNGYLLLVFIRLYCNRRQ